jgi:crossover junction endodeoxyribonuclease RuvC
MTNVAEEYIIGIDVGVNGALSIVGATGDLIAVFDMPCLADGPKGRRAINAALLAELVAKAHATQAFVESIGPRPQEGAVGAFSFGRCKGIVEGVLAALDVPVRFIAPPVWKRIIGIPPGKVGTKDMARSEAIRRWPHHAALFARVKDADRAEAALIAIAGLKREAST